MRQGTCKHYTGWFQETCEVGVCYKDVTPDPDEPGCACRVPCIKLEYSSVHRKKVARETGGQGSCDKYEEPTAEDIEACEAAITESTTRMMKTLPLVNEVKEVYAGKDWTGIKECPVCGGRLAMSHASYNGHVWGKCETENCVSWME